MRPKAPGGSGAALMPFLLLSFLLLLSPALALYISEISNLAGRQTFRDPSGRYLQGADSAWTVRLPVLLSQNLVGEASPNPSSSPFPPLPPLYSRYFLSIFDHFIENYQYLVSGKDFSSPDASWSSSIENS